MNGLHVFRVHYYIHYYYLVHPLLLLCDFGKVTSSLCASFMKWRWYYSLQHRVIMWIDYFYFFTVLFLFFLIKFNS